MLEKRSINKLEGWLRFTEIPDVLGISNVSTKELYESLSDVEQDDFEKIDKGMFRLFRKYEKFSEIIGRSV